MRACVLGPPASGKTALVEKICAHYKLHHIKVKDVIDDAIQKLEKSAARLEHVINCFPWHYRSMRPMFQSLNTPTMQICNINVSEPDILIN